MNIHKNIPSIEITISICILLNSLCFLIGIDNFYQFYSFLVVSAAIYFSTIHIKKKDYASLILVIIILCITETIFRESDNIPYLFSFYFIILVCLPFIFFNIKEIIHSLRKNLYLLNLLILILLVSLNAYGNFDKYFITFKKLAIPLIALFTVLSLSFLKKIKINFDNLYKYFLFFSLPMMLNVILFGERYIEPDFSSRIWPPWGDGTGPVAGLASFTIIICAHFILKKKNIFYIIALFISILALLSLGSRGSIIGIFICFGIYGIQYFLKYKKQRKWFIILIFTTIFLSSYIGSFKIIERLSDRFLDIELILTNQKRSGRIFVLVATIESLSERSFIGGGTGSFLGEIFQRISDFDIITRRSGIGLGDAHSFLLQNIFEHGILGMLVVLIFYFLTIKISFKHQQKYGGPLMILTLFITIYSFTTALKHGVMFIPYILLTLKNNKVET